MEFRPGKFSILVGVRRWIPFEIGGFPKFVLQGFFLVFGHFLMSSEFGPGKRIVPIGVRGWVFLKIYVLPILVAFWFFGNAFRNH